MPKKSDPSPLPRPKPIREERTFTDPLQPGYEVTLCMEASPDWIQGDAIAQKANELVADYLQGRNGGPPAKDLLPLYDGKPLHITENLCSAIACCLIMERPDMETDTWPEGEAAWNFHQWAIFSAACPSVFGQLAVWLMDLRARAEGARKNA